MRNVSISDIIIKPERQRQLFNPDAHQELISSIETIGLLHPPVIRDEDGELVLVAGERRLKAISEIFDLGGSFLCDGHRYEAGMLPVLSLGELSRLEAEEAELDENLKRRDLTWQEHAAATARLHALRCEQKSSISEAFSEDKGPVTPHTIADTAEEITGRRDGSYQDAIRKEILVASHLSNPAVAKAKSADEAFKILKKEEERKRNIEHSAVIGASFSASQHTALNMDCLTYMRSPEAQGKFDVICTDPPYGMNAQDFGDAAGKLTGIDHRYDDSYEQWQSLMKDWAPLSFAVTKPEAHLYAFCDIDNFHELKGFLVAAGWYVFRTPFILHKQNSGRVPLPDRGPRRQWESILYAIKGKKPVTHIYSDVISCTGDEQLSHGAQKPVAAFQQLLLRSVRAGDEVLDCFAGTGPVIPACHVFKCRATAIEQSPEHYPKVVKRIEQLSEADNQVQLDGL